jgi:drug/metabolite transporter (DMT)-like permease
MFYAVVDSNMKLIAGIGTIVFFRESLTWGQVTGFFIIFISLMVSLYDKKVKVDREVAAAMAAEVVK